MTASKSNMTPLPQDEKRHPASDPELPQTSEDRSIVHPPNASHSVNGALGDVRQDGSSKPSDNVNENDEGVNQLGSVEQDENSVLKIFQANLASVEQDENSVLNIFQANLASVEQDENSVLKIFQANLASVEQDENSVLEIFLKS